MEMYERPRKFIPCYYMQHQPRASLVSCGEYTEQWGCGVDECRKAELQSWGAYYPCPYRQPPQVTVEEL